jgi:NitT/TauT family transport system substrate-binding protein
VQIMQSRRDFLAGLSLAGSAGVFGTRSALADEGRQRQRRSGYPTTPTFCLAPATWPTICCTRKALPTSDMWLRQAASPFRQMAERGEIDLGITFTASLVFHLDAGTPVTALAGRPGPSGRH